MFAEIFILTILIIQFPVSTENSKDFSSDSNSFKNVGGGVIGSFISLKNILKNYFYISLDKLEKRRQKIKSAFYNFIDQSFYNGKHSQLSVTSFDEEVVENGMSASQMITLHGYRVESHTVVTLDGYILTIHRVKPGLQTPIKVTKKLALLHHGLLGSSDDWVLLGTGRALPYLLSDAGYDVWLANARGNKYSRAHLTKSLDTSEFWDFSWHEIGLYDLSAVIEYMTNITESKLKIDFIGHSMGATALLVLLSNSPKLNSVLKSVIFLSPLVFMYQIKGPLKMLAKYNSKNNSVDILRHYEFLPNAVFTADILEHFCVGEIRMCLNPLLLLANGGQKMSDPKLAENILSHVPAGGSTKTIIHYEQAINSGQFKAFDYGLKLNLKKYGVEVPPPYKLNSVTVPVVLFGSTDDWLSTIPGIVNLITKLPNLIVHHVVKRNGFSHTDFVWAEDAPELVFYLIIDILERDMPNKSLA